MIRQARELIASGEIGDVLAVRSSYLQGWLTTFDTNADAARGVWKTDPEKAGSGSLGDIGTHAFNLIRFVTGLTVNKIAATVETLHSSRLLDDYGVVQMRLENGTLGLITYSQMTHGRLNDFSLEIDGTRGALLWNQESPQSTNRASSGTIN